MSKFRVALTIVVCLALIGPAGMAAADDFPSKPIYMIVGYNPGGGTDMNARALASAATEYLNNQPLVIVNKPGAQGLLGPKFVATAKPDGYTLSMGWGNSEFSFGQYLMNIPFDWKKFKPIIACNALTSCLAVPADSPFKTVDELVAFAKENPGKLKWTHTGRGSFNHANGLDLIRSTGIKMTEMPNVGGSKTRNLVAGGHVDCAFFASFLALSVPDKVRVLGMAYPERDPAFPNVSTFDELGYKIMNAHGLFGIGAPPGTPDDRIQILYEAFSKTMEHKAFKRIAKSLGFVPLGWGPEKFQQAIDRDSKNYGELAKKLKAD